MTMKKHKGSLSISLFHTATKILLALISRPAWQHRYYSTKVGHWRKDFLEGHASFYFNFFCKRWLHASVTLQFPCTYICISNRVRSVSFSDGGLRDRDIIFGKMTQILYFVSLAAWSSFRHLKLTAGREGRVRILEILACLLLAFFYDQTHTLTQTRNRRCEDTRKGRKETESSSLHSISG